MMELSQVIPSLVNAGVEFIIVGGVAASAHGSARSTEDLDIVYRRTEENIERLVQALAPYQPYLRGAPPGLPFRWDEKTIRNGLNFTLTTSLGALDLLGEITGGGGYDDLLPHAVRFPLFGVECFCLGLERLIQVKRAAGRPKDFEAIAELEAILEERTLIQSREGSTNDMTG
jgi:predicted nucleotidyltransferase